LSLHDLRRGRDLNSRSRKAGRRFSKPLH